MSQLPKLSDGRELAALTISVAPLRFVYGEPEELEWLRLELLKRSSTGMPPQENQTEWRPIWR